MLTQDENHPIPARELPGRKPGDSFDAGVDPAALPATRAEVLMRELESLAARLGEAKVCDFSSARELYNWIPEPFVKRAIPSMIDKLLAEDGTLFFTNIAEGNPYRTWMEVFGNWTLIERSEEQIRNLIASRNGWSPTIEISKDATGLTFLVDVKKSTSAAAPALPRLVREYRR